MTTETPAPAIDESLWDSLRRTARAAMAHAYAPYSHFPVGAAALVAGPDGTRRVVSGCNVENASYGVGLCAECGLVSQLAATGGGTIVAFTCCDRAGARLMPCGRCRQLLSEHSGPDTLFDTPWGAWGPGELLPGAFGPRDLEER